MEGESILKAHTETKQNLSDISCEFGNKTNPETALGWEWKDMEVKGLDFVNNISVSSPALVTGEWLTGEPPEPHSQLLDIGLQEVKLVVSTTASTLRFMNLLGLQDLNQ